MKRINVPVLDESPGKCGPTSLRAVLQHYGVERTESELAKACGWTEAEGVSPGAMSDCAKAEGLGARVESGCTLNDLEEWAERGVPVIVDWDPHDDGVDRGSHYSVVVRVTAKAVELMDPEPARIVSVSRQKFSELWICGRAVVVERRSLKAWAEHKLRRRP